MKLCLILMSLFLETWVLAARADVTNPVSTEELRRKAVDTFNLRKFDEAEKLFYDVLKTDPTSEAANSATEYLKELTIRAGFLDQAIQKFRDLKLKGLVSVRIPDLSFSLAKRFDIAGGLQQFLFQALKKGGMISAHIYLISFLLEAKGMEEEATYYFNEAEKVDGPKPYPHIHKALVRPLHFSEPEFYSRFHLPDYSFAQLQTVPFLGDELSREYPSELKELEGGRRIDLDLGLFTQYDSNLVEKPTGGSLPSGITKPDGMELTYLAGVGVKTRASKNWTYGLDYRMWIQHPIRDDLGNYGRWSHLPAVWASWWNRTETEFRFRYDFALTWKNQAAYSKESQIHGPLFGLSHLWNQRYQTDCIYSFKNLNYFRSPRDNGSEHTFSLRFSYPGKNNTIQPFAKYTWNRDLTDDSSSNLIAHRLEVGATHLTSENLTTEVSTTLEYGIYPWSSTNRRDHTTRASAKFSYFLLSEFLTFLGKAEYLDQSSNTSQFTFKRFELSAGLVSSISF